MAPAFKAHRSGVSRYDRAETRTRACGRTRRNYSLHHRRTVKIGKIVIIEDSAIL